jgi:hypothetical protein
MNILRRKGDRKENFITLLAVIIVWFLNLINEEKYYEKKHVTNTMVNGGSIG